MTVFKRFSSHLMLAFAIRTGLIFYGDYQDSVMEVKFTDVDYKVFTDAARHIVNGDSPFDRHTYRYTPILAWMMVPNVTFHHLFGKFLFSLFDIIAGYLIYAFVKDCYSRHPDFEGLARKMSFLWLYNPLVFTVSARGNAESVIITLVLTVLLLYREKVYFLAGIAFGLAIHFKVYPIIYSVALYNALTERSGLFCLLCLNGARFRLVLGTLLTLMTLTVVCFHLYGWQFIEEAYLYHLTRKDTRHNFSVYFYMLYLTVDEEDIGLSLMTFLPQVILLLALSKQFGRTEDMPFCLFCQTFVFVVYNKVCTSQYFLWYMSLLPLSLPSLQLSRSEALTALFLWAFTQGSWLIPAYFLEFKGYNTFTFIWIESLAFFTANIHILSKFVRKYRELLAVEDSCDLNKLD